MHAIMCDYMLYSNQVYMTSLIYTDYLHITKMPRRLWFVAASEWDKVDDAIKCCFQSSLVRVQTIVGMVAPQVTTEGHDEARRGEVGGVMLVRDLLDLEVCLSAH